MYFDQLKHEYPSLTSQDGLIALLQEYLSEQFLCYPVLKDLGARLTLAGCTTEQIQVIKSFVADPMSWRPSTIEGTHYPTFGKFLVDKQLGKGMLYDRIEAVVHNLQVEHQISGLKPKYQRIRGVDIEYLAPTTLMLLDADKATLKAQIPTICKLFFDLAGNYNLVLNEWEGNYEVEKETTAAAILGASTLAVNANLNTESYQWEGNLGTRCHKQEPDRITLTLDLGFDEDSNFIEFKAVNPNCEL